MVARKACKRRGRGAWSLCCGREKAAKAGEVPLDRLPKWPRSRIYWNRPWIDPPFIVVFRGFSFFQFIFFFFFLTISRRIRRRQISQPNVGGKWIFYRGLIQTFTLKSERDSVEALESKCYSVILLFCHIIHFFLSALPFCVKGGWSLRQQVKYWITDESILSSPISAYQSMTTVQCHPLILPNSVLGGIAAIWRREGGRYQIGSRTPIRNDSHQHLQPDGSLPGMSARVNNQ